MRPVNPDVEAISSLPTVYSGSLRGGDAGVDHWFLVAVD